MLGKKPVSQPFKYLHVSLFEVFIFLYNYSGTFWSTCFFQGQTFLNMADFYLKIQTLFLGKLAMSRNVK